MYVEKSVPYDRDAEEATIGSILIDPEAIFKVDGFLKSSDFYFETNGWIYKACQKLVERSEVIDQITISRELAQQGKLAQIGGAGYLSGLIAKTPTSVNIGYYGSIVSRLSTSRKLIDAASKIAEIGFNADSDISASLTKAESLLYDIHPNQFAREFQPIKDVLDKYFTENITGDTKLDSKIITGFPAMDRILKSLQRSDLIIIGARPSLGKSSLALSIARNVAINQKGTVGIFSLEMSSEQLARRLLASESSVNYDKICANGMDDLEERMVMKSLGILSEANIYIDDSPHLIIDQLYSKTRRLTNEIKLDLLIVDYIQLVYGTERMQSNTVQEMTIVSRGLKTIARDFNIPVVALSQLSRAVMSRNKPRIPQLSDLRESGSIEQDADVVMLMYRADKDYTEQEWLAEHPGATYPVGVTDIEIAKHRNGATGNVQLYFRDTLTKFNSIELNRK